MARVDAHMVCLYILLYLCTKSVFISMWVLCLLVQPHGYARASDCGTSKEYGSHIFFMSFCQTINNFLKAESGDKEAVDTIYEKNLDAFVANRYCH